MVMVIVSSFSTLGRTARVRSDETVLGSPKPDADVAPTSNLHRPAPGAETRQRVRPSPAACARSAPARPLCPARRAARPLQCGPAMRLTVVAMAPLVMLAATMAGCDLSSPPICQSNENYCDGDTAHSCTTNEGEGHRSTTRCDPNTEACLSGTCFTLTDVPCDPAGDACDPSGRTAYSLCLKGRYVWETHCGDGELCAVAVDPGSGKNYAGCAIAPFE